MIYQLYENDRLHERPAVETCMVHVIEWEVFFFLLRDIKYGIIYVFGSSIHRIIN